LKFKNGNRDNYADLLKEALQRKHWLVNYLRYLITNVTLGANQNIVIGALASFTIGTKDGRCWYCRNIENYLNITKA
jgi:hypothetical protein